MLWFTLALLGCTLVDDEPPETVAEPYEPTILELWGFWAGLIEGDRPTRTTLRGAFVSSPRTTDGTNQHFMQDGKGPASALRVEMRRRRPSPATTSRVSPRRGRPRARRGRRATVAKTS